MKHIKRLILGLALIISGTAFCCVVFAVCWELLHVVFWLTNLGFLFFLLYGSAVVVAYFVGVVVEENF